MANRADGLPNHRIRGSDLRNPTGGTLFEWSSESLPRVWAALTTTNAATISSARTASSKCSHPMGREVTYSPTARSHVGYSLPDPGPGVSADNSDDIHAWTRAPASPTLRSTASQELDQRDGSNAVRYVIFAAHRPAAALDCLHRAPNTSHGADDHPCRPGAVGWTGRGNLTTASRLDYPGRGAAAPHSDPAHFRTTGPSALSPTARSAR